MEPRFISAEQIEDFTRINELDIKRIINERYWQDFKEEKPEAVVSYFLLDEQKMSRWIRNS